MSNRMRTLMQRVISRRLAETFVLLLELALKARSLRSIASSALLLCRCVLRPRQRCWLAAIGMIQMG